MTRLAKWFLFAVLSPVAVGAAAAGAPPSAAAAPAAARLLVCGGRLLHEPRGTVILACADANTEITATRWTSWTRSGASGTTDFGLNLCTPTCAASRISFFPDSTIRLTGARETVHGLLFTRAAITYRRHGVRTTAIAYPAT
jgi:hypothetical protein